VFEEHVLTGEVAILSPHLDDAVFSLGASIARASRFGTRARVVTVFAGDPDSTTPAGWWDERAGFQTEGEAARIRREEDRAACRLVGAMPVWLPFSDATYERTVGDAEIWEALIQTLQGAELVLLPGFPLEHVDHVRLTRLVLGRPLPDARVALYVEQPYAKRYAKRTGVDGPRVPPALELHVPQPVSWINLPVERSDRRAKRKAILAYRSQLPLFGRINVAFVGRLALGRAVSYEARRGGETLGWLPATVS
jgi:LmbE family N-acetylglucosaminyl deacetylase